MEWKLCRFTNLEAENMRSLERADMEDKKITELEEELRVREMFLTRAVILDSAILRQLDELCNFVENQNGSYQEALS